MPPESPQPKRRSARVPRGVALRGVAGTKGPKRHGNLIRLSILLALLAGAAVVRVVLTPEPAPPTTQRVARPALPPLPFVPPTVDGPRRVVIISADGLRPDLLYLARTPNVRALLDRGAYTLWAQTIDLPYTLPSHVSMVTGVTPARHGVTWNVTTEGEYPRVPTIFALAKRSGLTTAAVVGKTKFIGLTPPGSLDWSFQPTEDPVADAEVARQASQILREHWPDLLFVHLPGADNAGHKFGWGSRRQIAAVEAVDAAIGEVLQTIDDLDLRESTLVLFTADHGGSGYSHYQGDVRSMNIPWVAAGPGVQHGFDLSSTSELQVHIEDTFATACAFLGLTPPADVTGRNVTAIYEPPAELLRPFTLPSTRGGAGQSE